MAFNHYRSTTASNNAVTAASNTTDVTARIVLRGWNIINPNTYPVYLKFYDVNYTSVTVGTTAIKSTLMIPALGSVTEPWNDTNRMVTADLYLTYAVTKLLVDTDNTAPGNIIVELLHGIEGINL